MLNLSFTSPPVKVLSKGMPPSGSSHLSHGQRELIKVNGWFMQRWSCMIYIRLLAGYVSSRESSEYRGKRPWKSGFDENALNRNKTWWAVIIERPVATDECASVLDSPSDALSPASCNSEDMVGSGFKRGTSSVGCNPLRGLGAGPGAVR